MSLDFTGFETIPKITQHALILYVENKIKPGSFLLAVLRGDLFDAVGRADHDNQAALSVLTKFIMWRCPGDSYGSPEIVDEYLLRR